MRGFLTCGRTARFTRKGIIAVGAAWMLMAVDGLAQTASTPPPLPTRTTPQAGIRSTEPKTNVGSEAPKTCGDIRDRETALAMGCIREPQSEVKGTAVDNTGAHPSDEMVTKCLAAHLNQEQVRVQLSLRSPQFGPPSDAEKGTYPATEGTYFGGPNPVPEATPNCPPPPLNPQQVVAPLSPQSDPNAAHSGVPERPLPKPGLTPMGGIVTRAAPQPCEIEKCAYLATPTYSPPKPYTGR